MLRLVKQVMVSSRYLSHALSAQAWGRGLVRASQPFSGWALFSKICVAVLVAIASFTLATSPAIAGLTDDHYDGSIFPLYAGNGSLVPPKVSLAESFKRDNPTVLLFYLDDSSDCKQYSSVISQLDGLYGWAADFIALSADAIDLDVADDPTQPGFYYKGTVPQVVVFDKAGQVILDRSDAPSFETIDDTLRKVFDLLPRTESVELKRRPVNEINGELVSP